MEDKNKSWLDDLIAGYIVAAGIIGLLFLFGYWLWKFLQILDPVIPGG